MLKINEQQYKQCDEYILSLYYWREKAPFERSFIDVFWKRSSPYSTLVSEEYEFISSWKNLDEIRAYYTEKYDSYLYDFYCNPKSIAKDLMQKVDLSFLEKWWKSLFDTDEAFIEAVLRSLESWGITYELLKDISVWITDKTIANYNYRNKTIYINKQVWWIRKQYILLHELMHHIHLTLCDKSTYISEYDYWAGFREWVAIVLCEKLIQEFFPYLADEHRWYIRYIQERWLASYKFYTEWIELQEFYWMISWDLSLELVETQYVSCLKYPWYKETYYVYYCLMREKSMNEIIKLLYQKNSYEFYRKFVGLS